MFLFSRSSAVQPQTQKPPSGVASAHPMVPSIKKAANDTGVSFDYLLRTAQRESNLNPEAKASTSSATGAFQFIEQTWLGIIKRKGPQLGLARAADLIEQDRSGRYEVSNPGLRQRILDLRKDPEISARLAGALTNENRMSLRSSLGREPTGGELYIAHFLGASGARDLINLAERNPDVSAASVFPDAASVNRSIFLDENGRSRGVRDVYNRLIVKHDNAGVGSEAVALVDYDWRTGEMVTRSPLAIANAKGIVENRHVASPSSSSSSSPSIFPASSSKGATLLVDRGDNVAQNAYFPRSDQPNNIKQTRMSEVKPEEDGGGILSQFQAYAPSLPSSSQGGGSLFSPKQAAARYEEVATQYTLVAAPLPPARPTHLHPPIDLLDYPQSLQR